jgi:hypothetical protein
MRSTLREWPGTLIFLLFIGYLQYRCVRDFWPEVARTLKTRKLRGYLIGGIGIFSFFLTGQILIFVPWSATIVQHWGGPMVLGTIVITLTGFLIGNQTVARIPKKYTRKITKSDDKQAP